MNQQPTNQETPRTLLPSREISKNPVTAISPLEVWLDSLLDTPFEKWTDFEVARALRQRWFVEQLVPRALTLLKAEPLAGGYYDGDLLESFTHVPAAYWQQNPDQQHLAVEAVQAALDDPDITEVSQEVSVLLAVMVLGTIPSARS